MHRSHLALCGTGLLLALAYLVLSGGSAGGVGLLIAALACPLAMVIAMSVLMRHGTSTPTGEHRTDEPTEAADLR